MGDTDEGFWRDAEAALAAVVPRQAGAYGRYECEPGWTWTATAVDYHLWFVVRGRGTVALSRENPVSIRTGSLLLFRPGDSVQVQQNPDDRLTVLSCHFELRDRGTGRASDLPRDVLPGPVIEVHNIGTIAAQLDAIIRTLRSRSMFGEYAVNGMLMTLVADVFREAAASHGHTLGLDGRLQDAMGFMHEHPARRFRLDDIARRVGLSSSALSVLFRDQLGTTFRRFSVDVRLDRSRVLLRETVMSVSQVAQVLGYTDQFLFSRQFRARFGEPPRDYRDSVHNNAPS